MNDELEVTAPTCPQCSGEGAFIGRLGRLDWFRCVRCGWDFSQEHGLDGGHTPRLVLGK